MDQITIDTYNVMADDYDAETIDFWERFPAGFIDEFALRVDGKVLDVGSGPGRDGLLLKQRGMDITCLDASQTMVKICISKGLPAVLGDFKQIAFEDNTFSGVWAYTSLLHVPKDDIRTSLQEIYRILTDGGIFALGMIEGEGEIYKQSKGVKSNRLFSYYRKEELEELLTQNGFAMLYFDTIQPGSHRYLHFIAQKI